MEAVDRCGVFVVPSHTDKQTRSVPLLKLARCTGQVQEETRRRVEYIGELGQGGS